MSASTGEVFLADIFEGGKRPVVIVSRAELNRGMLYLAVPITSSRVDERRKYANYVFLPAGAGGLKQDSVAVAHLIQPVRRDFLLDRWGAVSAGLLEQIQLAIAWSIGLIEL